MYTLTIGAVNGVTVGTYTVRWGDGNSTTYTAAQIAAAGGQVTHTFTDGPKSPTIRVDLTDVNGIVYSGAAGLCVAVADPAHVSDAPEICDFGCVNDIGDYWTFSGTITDNDDPVEGDVVNFGGVLAGYNLTATAGVDGVFSLTIELTGLQEGYGHGADRRPARRPFQRGGGLDRGGVTCPIGYASSLHNPPNVFIMPAFPRAGRIGRMARRASRKSVLHPVHAGFSLVELLVVITIVGVLIALCCRRCRRCARPPGGCNAATASNNWRWPPWATSRLRSSFRAGAGARSGSDIPIADLAGANPAGGFTASCPSSSSKPCTTWVRAAAA